MDPERLGAKPTAEASVSVPQQPNWAAQTRPDLDSEDEPANKKQKT